MEKGFVGGDGNPYYPTMLRIGGGKSPRVEAVSLEGTMEQIAKLDDSSRENSYISLDKQIRLEYKLSISHIFGLKFFSFFFFIIIIIIIINIISFSFSIL